MSDADELVRAIKRFRNADTEMRRAERDDDPVRLNRAGTAYAIAKIALFRIAGFS